MPAPIEETGAATAAGRLYVMGGFNAAGTSLAEAVLQVLRWATGADGARANRLLAQLVTPQPITTIDESEGDLLGLLSSEGIVLRGGGELADRIARAQGKRMCQNLVMIDSDEGRRRKDDSAAIVGRRKRQL